MSDYRKDLIRKYADDCQEKARKYYQMYQTTGSVSQERTYRKYEDLSDICAWAAKWVDDEDDARYRRIKNINDYCDKLTHEKYTRDEVIAMLKHIALW